MPPDPASALTLVALPLVDRPPGAVLFRMAGREVSAAAFVAEARALAATLPESAYVANLCQDRYRFAVGLAACLLRGQTSLLSGDLSPGILARLAREFPSAYALTDAPRPGCPMPVHLADPLPPPAFVSEAPAPLLDLGQAAMIVLTSGSTGGPVGTRKCWGELVARSRAAGERFATAESDPPTIVPTVPAGHMYGLETTVLLPWHAATATWCGPTFFPADIARAVECAPGSRILITTPLHLGAMLRAAWPVRPPERVISATAPLEATLARAIEEAWGTTVLEIYGATEVGSVASRRTVADAEWTPYPGVLVEGFDDAPMISAPHAGPPRPLADRIARSADGRFRLLGRAGDLVKRAGRRASLEGLSRILTSTAGVRDGVFLAPDDLESRPTARLVAFAVAPGHTVASLMHALRSEIDSVFLPRPLVLLDAMPRDALGKLPREALLARLG